MTASDVGGHRLRLHAVALALRGPPLQCPTPRGAGAAASYGGRIYVFGGERDGLTVNEVAAYDPVTNAWSALAPMPTPRNHHGAALVGGKIYVIGGRPGNQSTNEEFDVSAQRWQVRPPMPTGRSGIAVAAIGQHVFVFGGEGNASSPAGTFDQNESYDSDADTWTTLQPMPMPRHGIGVGVVGNRIYIPGWRLYCRFRSNRTERLL